MDYLLASLSIVLDSIDSSLLSLAFLLRNQSNKEIYTIILYVIFNSITVLVSCVISHMIILDSLAISTIYGGISFEFLFIVPFMIIYTKVPLKQDLWVFSRDGLIVIIACVMLVVFLVVDFQGFFGIILLVLYAAFWLVNLKNDYFMGKVLEMFGASMDGDAGAGNNFERVVTRRPSVRSLVQDGFIKKEDPELIEQVSKLDSSLKEMDIDASSIRNRFRLGKAVYTVIFGIRNSVKEDFEARASFYEDCMENRRASKKSDDVKMKREPREINRFDLIEEMEMGEGIPEEENEGELGQREEGGNTPRRSEGNEDASLSERVRSRSPNRKISEEVGRRDMEVENSRTSPSIIHFPRRLHSRILWFLILPVLITFAPIPNIHRNPTIKKTFWVCLIVLVLLLGIAVLLHGLEILLAGDLGIPQSVVGFIVNGVGINIALAVYSIRNYQENSTKNCYVNFQQLSIFQICVALGGTWILGGFFFCFNDDFLEQWALVTMGIVFLSVHILSKLAQAIWKFKIGVPLSLILLVVYGLVLVVVCIVAFVIY